MRRKMYSVKERSVVCEGGTLTYRLERKPVKNINLRVKSDGSVVVSANRSVSAAHIDNLVREKENFIRKALDRTVPISQEAAPLTKAQKAELLLLFEEVCREVYPLFYKYRIPYPRLKVRKMKTLWGSCHTKKGSITLNSRLADAPPDCIRYVMIHELTHFIHPNHSGEFWRVVEEMMPEWRERRKELRHCAGTQ